MNITARQKVYTALGPGSTIFFDRLPRQFFSLSETVRDRLFLHLAVAVNKGCTNPYSLANIVKRAIRIAPWPAERVVPSEKETA